MYTRIGGRAIHCAALGVRDLTPHRGSLTFTLARQLVAILRQVTPHAPSEPAIPRWSDNLARKPDSPPNPDPRLPRFLP
jgi:hypothetical protein